MLGLEAEGDARGARLDALHARLGVRGPFRVDRDEPSGGQRVEARRERRDVLVHLVGIVLTPVDGDGAHAEEKPREELVAEERGRGEVVDLARHHGPHDERVDEVVRVVDAEQHGAPRRDTLAVPDAHAPEEEPDPETRDPTDERVRAIHAVAREPRRRGDGGHRL